MSLFQLFTLHRYGINFAFYLAKSEITIIIIIVLTYIHHFSQQICTEQYFQLSRPDVMCANFQV